MKMKKIVYFLILLLAGVTISSCSKDFLETKPTNAFKEADVLATTDNLMGALHGIHKNMYRQYSQQSESGQGGINITLEAMADDVVWPHEGNGWFRTALRWTDHRNKSGGAPSYFYTFYYRILGNANKILDVIDNAIGSDANKKIIKGQALLYRAHAYFGLVQVYGKRYDAASAATDLGVPLITTFTLEPQPRATVAAVYQQIEADLTEGIALLTGYNRGSDKTHLNAAIGEGLYARVALTKGEWANAKTHAINARTAFSGGRLMTDVEYLDGFNDITNPEWIWGSRVVDDQTLFFYAFHAYMSYNFNSTNIRQAPKVINNLLYDKISATDVRKGLWIPAPVRGSATATPPVIANPDVPTTYSLFPYMNVKYAVKNSGSSVADIPYMRLAEMYLIQAEAEARLGETANAQTTLFDLVKTRDAGYVKSTATGQALVDEIMIQRRVELWGEGMRWLDLKRLNLPLDRRGANMNATLYIRMEVAAGDIDWQFHFPKVEEDSNPFILENPNP